MKNNNLNKTTHNRGYDTPDCGCYSSPEICGCTSKIDSKCVFYNSHLLEILNVKNGDNLEYILQQLNNLLLDIKNTIEDVVNLKNVGTGIGIYKGVNANGEQELRTLKADSGIIINKTVDEVSIKIDNEKIKEIIPTVDVVNIGNGMGIYEGSVTENKIVKKRLKSLTPSDSIVIKDDPTELNFSVNEIWLDGKIPKPPVVTIDTLKYSNPNPTTCKVGGIDLGTRFDNVSIKKILDDMLYGNCSSPVDQFTFTINTIYPSDAVVTINGQQRTSITVDAGTVVNYSVARTSFITKTGTVTVTNNQTIDVTLEPDLSATDIIFKINTTQANENVPVILLRTKDTQTVARIDYGDGIVENVTVPVYDGSQSWTDGEGNVHFVDNGNTFKHRYANPGTYEIRVIAANNIYYTRFADQLVEGNTGYLTPVNNNYITEVSRYRSSSISNLDYSLAGLPNANVISTFKLEVPEATTMDATFYNFGYNKEFTAFPADMLSLITKPKALRGTFFLAGLKKILPGFLDSLFDLESVWECFKNSKLGKGNYNDVEAGTYISQAIEGTNDFIPVSLFWKNPKLKDISHVFNYIGEGFFGNVTSGYLAYHVIRRELLWNGKSLGNVSGTIERAFYAFAKNNRVLLEPNFLKYAPNMIHLGGIFTQTNQTQHAVSWGGMIPIGADESKIYTFDANGAVNGTVDGKGLTFDLGVMFPNSYPKVLTVNGAFTVAANGGNYGFQHDIDYTLNGSNVKFNIRLNGEGFLNSKFPNAKAGSVDAGASVILGQSGGTNVEKMDGRNGVFFMLDQDDRFTDKSTIPSLVFNNAIPY